MSWFTNLKIRTKLILSFAAMIVLVLAMSVYAISKMNSLSAMYAYVLNYPQQRLIDMEEFKIHVEDLRRLVGNLSTYASINDDNKINGYIRDAEAAYGNALDKLSAYADNVNEDPQLSRTDKSTRATNITEVQTALAQYKEQIVNAVAQDALQYNHAETLVTIDAGANIIGDLMNKVDDLLSTAITTSNAEIASAEKTTADTITITMVIVALVILLAFILALAISSIIVKPIQRLVDVADHVARGNLNVNIDNTAKDETGMLSRSFSSVVQNVNTIIADINMMHTQHEDGVMSTRIDDRLYQGAYQQVASGVNEMVASYVSMINDIFNVLTDYAGGTFTTRLQQYKGEKAVANDQMDIFRETIQNIVTEIDNIAKAGADGKLSTRANDSRYKGDWQNIMIGLNKVMDAVVAPIMEAQAVMAEMAKGNFDAYVNGDYKGDFAEIKTALNNTVSAIAGYIKEITEVLGRIAQGDLRVSIKRDYIGQFSFIKESINTIVQALNKTMTEILSASRQVLSGAKQISSSAMSLAEGASEQASAIEELTASVETINNQTQANADNATSANELSDKSTKNAQNGNTEMQNMLDAMGGIKESSNNISKIIKVISDIAFQTNLLALNAAVEAARAGEHGKGFAVVSEEVRNLASKSQTSADDTTALIDDSNARVADGMRIAQSTAESLYAIVESASQVSGIIKTIAESSKQQAEAISQVSIGLSQISQVVQNNSSTSEESAAAAQQLTSQAELLQQMVSYFKI